MISGKDINFDDARQILTINGEKHAVLGDPAIPSEIDALDDRVTALEGSSVSDFEKITGTSEVVTTGTLTAGFLKSNIANYSEFMFVAYCEDDTAAVPAPIILSQILVQRVVNNKNSFSVTNGTITFSVKPQASVPVNYVNAELTGIITTDKRYYIDFYGRPV